MLALLWLALVAGSLVYCVLTVIAAQHYSAVRPPRSEGLPPISVLKPLAGADLLLEENLRTFFEQKYPNYELLFAVRGADDPAIPVLERLRAAFPAVPSTLIVTGEPPYPNAKVFSLHCMAAAARYDLLLMADSDVRVTPTWLATVAAEFQDAKTGVVTCPYRAVAGASFWSRLEAIGFNTDFLGGVLVARLVDRMDFALGPVLAVRRQALADIGGFSAIRDYRADDSMLPKLAAELGWRVVLSSYVIERHIGSLPFLSNLKHRLRWNRSARRARTWSYIGRIFTNPLPLALIFCAAIPEWWPVLLVASAFRALSARATAVRILADPLTRANWWLVPVQDCASFVLWLAAIYGKAPTLREPI